MGLRIGTGPLAQRGGSPVQAASRPWGGGLIFEDLSAFVVVARVGSFSRAAVELCVAQSALSKRVQRLEHGVGTALFERRARGVALTQAGQSFLARAQRVVDEVADMERNLSTLVETPSGEVRIALPQRTCGLLAPPVIERCRSELPLVDLQVLEGTPSNVHGWLLRGEADIAMTYNPELGPEFVVQPFMSEPLYLIAPAEATPMPRACTFADLGTLPMILPKKPHIVRVLVDRLCASSGVRANIIYETDGAHTIRGMVERGMGYSVFSLSTTWSYAIEAGRLVAVPFASPLMNWKMCLVRARKSLGAVAVHRVNEIVQQEAELLLERGSWPAARRIADPVPADGAN